MIFRVSHLEAYRRWREDEDADTERLLANIRGQGSPTDSMRAGTALHAALEVAQEGEIGVLIAEGHRFVIECNIALVLPEIRELRLSKEYGPITVSGCVDILEGKRIEDHKSTGKFEPDWYLPSYQWRYYLDIFDADVFRWNVFEMDFDRVASNGDRVYRVFGFHQLEQTRYPALHDDCMRLACDFADFVSAHVPEHLLEAA